MNTDISFDNGQATYKNFNIVKCTQANGQVQYDAYLLDGNGQVVIAFTKSDLQFVIEEIDRTLNRLEASK